MFNGKTIVKTEILDKFEDYIGGVKLYFEDGDSLVIASSRTNGLIFASFDNKSKKFSKIHADNID